MAATCLNQEGRPGRGGCDLSWTTPSTKIIRLDFDGSTLDEQIDHELSGHIPYGSGLLLVAAGKNIGRYFQYASARVDPAFVEESSPRCRTPDSRIDRGVDLADCPRAKMRASSRYETVKIRPRIRLRLRGDWSRGGAVG